jgi:polysaccharide export outer membrane protein
MNKIRSIIPFVIGLLVAVAVVMSARADEAPSYKINPGDAMNIYVWNEESLTRDVVVSPDGFISFPLAGQIQAGGKTSAELEGALAAALGKYLKDEPTVTASLIQLEGNIVYVLGKVNRPGPYPINRPTDVTQALAMAGGLNQFAAENSIKIEFEYGDVKDGDALETNILLKAGDVVVVP